MNLKAVLEYIEGNLAGDLSLQTLARRGGLSPYHFHRRFHAAVGEPPKRYVRRLRLERAATRLKLSRRSVTDVAFAAGYATHEAFTRAFARQFGVSPQRFRATLPMRNLPAGFAPRLVRLPARRIAYLRYVGPYDRTLEAFERLARWAAARGVLGDSMLGFFWDDQDITAAAQTRCQVALVVDERVEGEGDIAVREQPAREYAVFDHAGEVPERRSYYEAAFRIWLPSIGRVPANAPPFEEYPVTHRGIEQGSTRIYIPLRPR
jgi:AraC family transcriptional regulator